MRNLIIYELESEYANYLQALGAPSKLVRKYAYGNAVLPQMSGLALALGAVVGGALVTEIVFGYPGIGTLIITALQNRDYFLMQGLFLMIIIGVLDRQLHRRHRLRDRRPAYARRDPGVVVSTLEPRADLAATPELALTGDGAGDHDLGPEGQRFETLYFAFHNTKLVVGLTVVLLFLVLAIVGPLAHRLDPFEFGYPLGEPPSTEYWLGTTSAGQDVYAQFVYGLRSSFLVGAIAALVAGSLGMAIGFVGGYLGGVIDDILSMLTNIVLVIPTLAVLIIVAAYLKVGSLWSEALLIGLTSWPWAARAIRAQTFSLAARDFVNLARLSGRGTTRVIVNEIAPNMSSYLFLVAHPPLRRLGADRGDARLPRARPVAGDVARADDEHRRLERRPPARPVVVVHPAGDRDHRRSSAASTS